MKALDALRIITDLLSSYQIEDPEAKAKVIVSHVLAETDVFAKVGDKEWSAMLNMADKAGQGVPVEYITGKAYFRYTELSVTPDVLIPRKETELVAGEAIELMRQKGFKTVLDMCTGSGCIAISIAAETGAEVSAADISEKAAALAEKNAEANGAAVNFFISDMFTNIRGTYDIIVCNPPYVSNEEYEALLPDVKEYEPAAALKAGDGLDFYRIIAAEAPKHLAENGALVLEIGARQAQDVMELLEAGGFTKIECKKDYQKRDRIVTALKGR